MTEKELVNRVMELASWCTDDKERLARQIVREILAAAESRKRRVWRKDNDYQVLE